MSVKGPAKRGLRWGLGLREIATALRDPVLAVWIAYLILVPLYVFPSGLPQPGDMLIFVLAPLAFSRWNGRLRRAPRQILRPLMWFTAYVLIINVGYAVVLGAWSLSLKRGFIMSPSFYIYNALIFLIALILHERYGERFISLTVRVVILSALLQLVVTQLLRSGVTRDTGLFENPNQLGYYAVLSASIMLIAQQRLRLPTWLVQATLMACAFLAVLSSSKAALGCIALLIAFGMFNRLRTVVLAVVIGGAFALFSQPVIDAVQRAEKRIATDETLGFFEERGYDRITSHPEYWLLGSGEGFYKRFDDTTAIGDHELHSSIGTLFFCYGIVGTLLFAGFAFKVVRRGGFRQAMLLLPAAAYGMTHQGMRFTLLWVLLAVFVMLKERAPVPAATNVSTSARPAQPPLLRLT